MHETPAVDPTPFWRRRRYFVVMMAFFGLFNVYALRINLSVAIVAMTENRTIEHSDGSLTYEQYFPWDSKQKGYVLSSFFYGYLLTQVAGGVLAAKIGGNLVRIISIIEWQNDEIFLLSCLALASESLRFLLCLHQQQQIGVFMH